MLRKDLVVVAAAIALAAAGCAEPVASPPPPPAENNGSDASTLPMVLFGIGPQADQAQSTRLARETPVRMLTSWYNGPDDLSWITGWRNGFVSDAYAKGYAMHLVVWAGDAEARLSTRYGPACGRAYPLSDRFLTDMGKLADTFAGATRAPPLYVTLFSEFQTYPCTDNSWNPDSYTNNYYRALKDRYLDALSIFRTRAPNARVSLGWGGWQTRWDSPSTGAGRSMFQHFADVMRLSQFQSFQAMQNDSNVDDVREMTATLGAYGPVMLAHYKPDNESQTTFDADSSALLTKTSLRDLTGHGLFAYSFMDDRNLSASESTYQLVASAVRRYASTP